MNLWALLLGVFLGWCCLLALPWILTGNSNPLESSAGYVMLVPLLIPVLILGETGGGRCPAFLHARLKWISQNSELTRVKLLIMGFFHGVIFAIPSAAMITLAVAYTVDSTSVLSVCILGFVGLIHLTLFCASFVVSTFSAGNWGRRIFRSQRNRNAVDA